MSPNRIISLNNSFIVLKDTRSYPITPYTKFFIANFPLVTSKTVLDFGTGNGIYSIISSKLGAKESIGIDIRNKSRDLFISNSRENNCINTSWFNNASTLLKQRKKVDIIICNPSSIPNNDSKVPFYMNGGSLGNSMIIEMIELASRVLKTKGKLFFLHTSLVPQSITQKILKQNNFSFHIIKSCIIPFRKNYFSAFPTILANQKKYSDIKFIKQKGIFSEIIFLYEAKKIK